MACRYELNDHGVTIKKDEFGMNFYIDNFYHYDGKISDVVFSTTGLSQSAQIVHDKMESKFGKHRNAGVDERLSEPFVRHSTALEIESEGQADALALIGRNLPNDTANLGVSDILSLKGITNVNGMPLIPRFDEDEFFKHFNLEMQAGTIADINKKRFIMEYFGSGHPEESVEYKNEWDSIQTMLKNSSDKRNEVSSQLRLKWYYQKGYGRLLHAVAQKVVRFIENRKSFDHSMMPELYQSVKTSDAYKEALRIEDSYNNQIEDRELNEDHMDNLISSITDGVLGSLMNINVVEFNGGKYFLKPDTKLYAEIPVKGKTHIQYPDGSPYTGNFTCSGVIDLVVVDNTGRVKIFDWKAGLIHNYNDYDNKYQSRREAIAYQLAIYRRLLANTINIREEDIDCAFIGYEHKNFRLDKHGSTNPKDYEYIVDDIVAFGGDPRKFDYTRQMDKIRTIDWYIMKEQPVLETKEDLYKEISEFRIKAFGNTDKEYSDDDITLIIANNGGIYKNTEGRYECILYDQRLAGSTEEEVRNKAAEYIKSPNERKGYGTTDHVLNLTKHLKELKMKGLEYSGQKNNPNNTGANQLYFNDIINKYMKGPYEVVEYDEALQNTIAKLGVILFRNTYTGTIDVVHIMKAGEIPYKEFRNNNGSYITNKMSYNKDNTDKKLLKNTPGARNAIVDTILLTKLAKENGVDMPINQILSVNEYANRGEVISNEQIYYSMNKLYSYMGIDKKEMDGVRLISKLGICQNLAQEIIARVSNPQTRKGLKKIGKLKEDLLDPITKFEPESMYIHATDPDVNNAIASKIYEWLNSLEDNKKDYAELMTFAQTLGVQTIDEELYQYLNAAYAKAMGFDFNQDAEYKTASWSVKKGYFTANNIENAGYFDNDTLNTITTAMVTNLQVLRQKLAGYLPNIRSHVNILANNKGFDKITERTFGNKTLLYSNLIEKGVDYMNFKHPDDPHLSPEEKEFLKYTLETINKRRGLTPDNEKYYWVPLMHGNKYTADSVQAYIARAKGEFSDLLSKGSGSLDNDNGLTVENKDRQSDFWSLNSGYATGDAKMHPDARKLKIRKTEGGVDMFECDIENILIGFLFEHERLETLKKVMPIVRAGYAYANNATLYGNLDNRKMKDWIEDYVRVNIHRESIVSDDIKKPMAFVNKIKNFVTKFALAFSPVQFTYQMLAGNLKNLELALSKHDVNSNFTASDLLEAKKIVYSNMFVDNGSKTIVDLLNEMGGFNAINMKHYTEAVTSNRNGIHHIGDRLAMKFAEKPDFYNRLELVVAQMIHDGYFDAVSVKDGRLIYDFKKDGRFKHISKGDTTSAAAKKELGLYYAMAKDLANSGVSYPDGTHFTMPKFGEIVPLPTFWTPGQVTTLKDVGDLAYGYYDDMNKMMFSHEWYGQLITHFRTYWPAKKSQWLAQGGTKLRGHYAQKMERVTNENGSEKLIKYYYKKDKDGNLTEEITTDENEAYCAYQEWVGDYHEGIVSSIIEVVKSSLLNDPDTIKLSDLKRRIDNGTATESERSMYMEKMGNLVQAGYMLAALAIGYLLKQLADDLLKRLRKNAKETKELDDLMLADAANLLDGTIKSATGDFDPWGSLGGPVLDSNPIMTGYITTIFQRYVSCITGDANAWDATVKSMSATRQLQNTISYLKPDYIDEQDGVIYAGRTMRKKGESTGTGSAGLW